jgi:hypothetical protein
MTNYHDGHIYLDVVRPDGHHEEIELPDEEEDEKWWEVVD